MRVSHAGVLFLTVLAVVCASGPSLPGNPDTLEVDLGEVPDFAFTDQDGRTVRRADLLGKVWVASFIFTRCPGECVKITENLGRLQQHLGRQGDVVLVSFTVDPEHDTPQVLVAYAKQKGADPDRWMFLTGPRDPLLKFLRETFYEPVQPGSEIGHSPRLMAVDADGHIHGYVDGTDRAELPRLRHKLRWLVLAKYQYFPTVNAALNGLSGLLLLAGFIAIRTRRVAAHKALMLAALAVSAAFLACYLYYHYVVLGGRPSGFPGEGWVRPAYFAVLVSHTLLAAVVAPLAVVTAYRGLRGNLARHVRVARWTLPLWLYVSATGVLVYYLRYHLYP